jgi:uncharacterized protein
MEAPMARRVGTRRWRGLRRIAALVVGLSLTGCAAALGGYDLAPSGLTRDEDTFRRMLAAEAPTAYRSVLEGRALPDDDLLRLLYAGIAGRYAGALEESSHLLDLASYMAEDRVTLSLSREALSLVTSDRALAWVPGATERLMIPYLAALNFLDAGDVDAAAVEARRIEALLDQLHDGTPPEERPANVQFLHYLAGAVFEAAGDWVAADVAYRRAGSLPGTPTMPWDRQEGVTDGVGAGVVDPGEDSGDVIVLVERGFSPHRVEQSVIIVLPPRQVKMLTEGSAGERAVAAAAAAARILLTASMAYGDGGYYRDHRYRTPLHLDPWRDEHEDSDEDDDGTPYLLRVSWPVLYQDRLPSHSMTVRAGGVSGAMVARLDVGDGVRRDFDGHRPTMLARTLARGVSKVALSAAVEQTVAKRDEDAGRLAGILTNLGTMATERADVRCWHLLPGEVAMVRLRLAAGTHEVVLDTEDGAMHLGPVTVRPGRTTFLTTRLWH